MAITKGDEKRRRIAESRYQRVLDEPNWNVWKKISNAPLWEAVAVSCNIAPQELRGWKDVRAKPTLPKTFVDRLLLAESILSIHGGGLACRPEGAHSSNVRVELGNFRAWLEYEGCTFPPEFPKYTAKNPPSETPEERKLRLTHRIEEIRATRKNFMAFVAAEEKINVPRLQQIVGTMQERKQRLAQNSSTP